MYQDGAPGIQSYPQTQDDVLAAVAAASGVPTPDNLSANVVSLAPTNTAVLLLPPNPNRSYLLIYNPTFMSAQFSFGVAVQGGLNNLPIGAGEAFFWATAQGLAPCYRGPLTAVGLLPLFLWVWEDGSDFYNNGGALAATTLPQGYPTSDAGLPVGAIWSNSLEISVVPGFVPNPAAPRVFFGSITAAQLLVTGGGNFPLNDPFVNNQLWNDQGVVAISAGTGGGGPQPFVLDQSVLDGPNVLT